MDDLTRERYPGVSEADLERERRAARPAEPTAPLRVHVFHPTQYRDHRGVRICECGSTKDASIHRVPERTDDERDHEARRIGERA